MTLERVRAALALLETRDVTILGLHYVEDLTYQEIADTLRDHAVARVPAPVARGRAAARPSRRRPTWRMLPHEYSRDDRR